ncbi:TraK family protein [Desulfotalea psychrophila]|uniref:Uncharacterized protein n=1 Tax=Desulfotalea psychrophila (strain LSv54 / DSM 12343) TaxID=177439 RepID=Q6AIH4_DESPS|nr:TraK family protein [Desulfotalea psychrophila]CAG37873.1 hypothetical protein DPPB09 [Desulfotalea psychrophila LSv54]
MPIKVKNSKLKPRGTCRIELMAVKEEVFNLIEIGYSKKAIHEYLTEQKQISMSFTSFVTLIRNVDSPNPFSRKKKATKTTTKKDVATDSKNEGPIICSIPRKSTMQHSNTAYSND